MQGAPHFYPDQRLSLSKPWEGLRMICQGFKPDSGNPTVRHYRGALRNVRQGETRGYFVSTVGRNEEMIRAYIRHQEMADKQLDQLQMKLASA